MHAVEVQYNGATICTVGAANAVMFSADISMFVEGPEAAMLNVRGMNDLGNDRTSHTGWIDELDISNGDRLVFRFVDVLAASPPEREVASDSEEHLTEQLWYETQLRENPMNPRELKRDFPNTSLQLSFPGAAPVIATLEGDREFISFQLMWNQWRPERCRVSLSSFSQQEALARAGSKEWLQGNLKVGEECIVKVSR
jgi:hypothetical protein